MHVRLFRNCQLLISKGFNTPDRGQWKMLTLSTNVEQNKLETEFFITICRTDEKWQSKTLLLLIFDPLSSIAMSVFGCCLSGVFKLNSYTCSVFASCLQLEV